MTTQSNRFTARMLRTCAHHIQALLPLAVAAQIVADVLLICGVRP